MHTDCYADTVNYTVSLTLQVDGHIMGRSFNRGGGGGGEEVYNRLRNCQGIKGQCYDISVTQNRNLHGENCDVSQNLFKRVTICQNTYFKGQRI